jgi:hypothetical protein
VEILRPDLSAIELVGRLGELGIKTGANGPALVRLVTHWGITREDVERTIEAVRQVMKR